MSEQQRLPLNPRFVGIGAFVAGLLLVAAAFAVFEKQWSIGELAYDVGIGVLIAAAVAVGVDSVARRFEEFEREIETKRREASEREKEEAERRQATIDAEWAAIATRLDELGRGLDATTIDTTLAVIRSEIMSLHAKTVPPLREIQVDLKETRRQVDPAYRRFLEASEDA